METSIIIAQIMGITFTVMGASLFFNKKASIALIEEATKNVAFLWILGFLTLTLGSTIVVFNNVWSSGVELFITIIGWLTLIKGAVILLFPDSSISLYKNYKNESLIAFGGAIAFILGLVLMYNGFL